MVEPRWAMSDGISLLDAVCMFTKATLDATGASPESIRLAPVSWDSLSAECDARCATPMAHPEYTGVGLPTIQLTIGGHVISVIRAVPIGAPLCAEPKGGNGK